MYVCRPSSPCKHLDTVTVMVLVYDYMRHVVAHTGNCYNL